MERLCSKLSNEKFQSVKLVFGPRFEAGTFQIQGKVANRLIVIFGVKILKY
jgi:hypothetical protein